MIMILPSVLIGHNIFWDKLTPLLISIGQLNRKQEKTKLAMRTAFRKVSLLFSCILLIWSYTFSKSIESKDCIKVKISQILYY